MTLINQINPNPNGTFTVTKEFLEELINTAVNRSAERIGDRFFYRIKQERGDTVELFDKRLYNVKLLLEHYHMFKEHVQNTVFDLKQIEETDSTAIEILDAMMAGDRICKEDLIVESLKKSAYRTGIILRHIDEMKLIFEQIAYANPKEEMRRKYEALNRLYFTPLPEGKSRAQVQQDIADEIPCDVRQVRRDVSDALERFTALLFGIDGVFLLDKRKNRKKELKTCPKDVL